MSESEDGPPSLTEPVALTREVVRHALARDVPFMAGAIAYQAFVSLLPLLFLLVVATSVVGDAGLTTHLLDIVSRQLPSSARDIVRRAVRSAVSQTGNSVVGAVILGFGAVAVFNGLDKAFTDLYDADRGANLPNQLRDAFVVLTALGAAIIAITVAWLILPTWVPYGGLLRPIAIAVGLAVAFYPMFYVFPEIPLGWQEVLPGVVVTAVGWTLLQSLFALYVRFVVQSQAFGVISGVLVLATWLYFGGFVLLLGASLNAVLHGRSAGATPDDASTAGASLTDSTSDGSYDVAEEKPREEGPTADHSPEMGSVDEDSEDDGRSSGSPADG